MDSYLLYVSRKVAQNTRTTFFFTGERVLVRLDSLLAKINKNAIYCKYLGVQFRLQTWITIILYVSLMITATLLSLQGAIGGRVTGDKVTGGTGK